MQISSVSFLFILGDQAWQFFFDLSLLYYSSCVV